LNLANERSLKNLYHQAGGFLNARDGSFPKYELPERELEIRHDFYGYRYAEYIEEGVRAVECVRKNEGIELEGTYTGKTFAALMEDAKTGRLKDRVVLFWNTYNSRDFSAQISGVDYKRLPVQLQRYFDENVQPLDRRTASV